MRRYFKLNQVIQLGLAFAQGYFLMLFNGIPFLNFLVVLFVYFVQSQIKKIFVYVDVFNYLIKLVF
ncbi:MAG: hypothetical protein A2260_01780 [Candidatus Komeilibacteria bacterium RIFOXYA2_FULL_45_9]|nr:MAG: hypothetical protein A2260_01780 [Candidatus Komeilibacteria bacterium RIFOXYA2_FULL_45_9]